MSLGNTFENDLAKLIFQGTAIANIADNAAASPLTNLYLSLHTADPGEGGSQSTNEATYGGYARPAVARNSSGFTVTNNLISLTAAVDFAKATSPNLPSPELEMFFGIGTAPSGAGKLLASGPLGTALGGFTGATNDTITIPGLTGLVVDDRIAFFAPPGSVLPTGLTEGTVYWVKTVSGDAVTVSATQGGATLDVTAVGEGEAWKITPIAVSTNVIPRLGTGTLLTFD